MNSITWAGLLPALPAILGVLVAFAVELLTKATAPAWLKRTLGIGLSVLAGVIPTVAYNPHNVPAYLLAVALAWAVTIATHVSGITGQLQTITAGFGLGPSGKHAAPGGTPMHAGATTSPQPPEPFAPAPPAPAPAATPPVVHS